MTTDLERTARALVARGKGILAADESSSTIEKRLKTIGVPSTAETRRAYRELLFTTRGCEEHISGVILYDETIRQSAADGTPFAKVLEKAGIIPGIKVDKGAKALPFAPGEKITEGLDGLRERLEEYRGLGARFAKWRAVITIGAGLPSDYCIDTNAHALARYAALCVEQGLVPIVEPEVLMDGAHTIEDCYAATERTLRSVFAELAAQRVPLEQTLLKPNMVLPASDCPTQVSDEQIADATVRCFKRTVPAAVSGIVFLSGGQSEQQAAARLSVMNSRFKDLPWPLSFSYGRALQASALQAWKGKPENVAAGQKAFLLRAKLAGSATRGEYSPAMERAA